MCMWKIAFQSSFLPFWSLPINLYEVLEIMDLFSTEYYSNPFLWPVAISCHIACLVIPNLLLMITLAHMIIKQCCCTQGMIHLVHVFSCIISVMGVEVTSPHVRETWNIKDCCTQDVIHGIPVFYASPGLWGRFKITIYPYNVAYIPLHLVLELDWKPALFEHNPEWWRIYITINHQLL